MDCKSSVTRWLIMFSIFICIAVIKFPTEVESRNCIRDFFVDPEKIQWIRLDQPLCNRLMSVYRSATTARRQTLPRVFCWTMRAGGSPGPTSRYRRIEAAGILVKVTKTGLSVYVSLDPQGSAYKFCCRITKDFFFFLKLQ